MRRPHFLSSTGHRWNQPGLHLLLGSPIFQVGCVPDPPLIYRAHELNGESMPHRLFLRRAHPVCRLTPWPEDRSSSVIQGTFLAIRSWVNVGGTELSDEGLDVVMVTAASSRLCAFNCARSCRAAAPTRIHCLVHDRGRRRISPITATSSPKQSGAAISPSIIPLHGIMNKMPHFPGNIPADEVEWL